MIATCDVSPAPPRLPAPRATVDSDPRSAIVRVERLAPRDRVLVRGYYYRVTAVEHADDAVFLTLDDGLRRRFAVGATLGCELRAVR